MLAINLASWAPHLEAFQHDSDPPTAILIEYLPQPLVLNCATYSKERMQKAEIGIRQIHLALIEHNDPYPKNVLIVPGDPERVIWIDFDVSIVYPNNTYIGDKERSWIEEESLCVEGFVIKLVRSLPITNDFPFCKTNKWYRQMIKDGVFLRIQSTTRKVTVGRVRRWKRPRTLIEAANHCPLLLTFQDTTVLGE